jgi:hypothetical protein
MSEKKIDYTPPGWIVTWFDFVRLDMERAQKFNDLRFRLCAALGQDNEICFHNNLWMKALDLLLAHEAALLTKVENLDENFNTISDPV